MQKFVERVLLAKRTASAKALGMVRELLGVTMARL